MEFFAIDITWTSIAAPLDWNSAASFKPNIVKCWSAALIFQELDGYAAPQTILQREGFEVQALILKYKDCGGLSHSNEYAKAGGAFQFWEWAAHPLELCAPIALAPRGRPGAITGAVIPGAKLIDKANPSICCGRREI
ncbi:hypothetical protein EVAR_27057_1 [Eumeta japonica]|uniref:Uncharacterized protein n=1 Tax=Eumeta variegata TaxID=151549 RepID=A0A4C1WGU7_EUMVA|nr:hypothetical protein EVAR_27057_1 [Eumeta japonica]